MQKTKTLLDTVHACSAEMSPKIKEGERMRIGMKQFRMLLLLVSLLLVTAIFMVFPRMAFGENDIYEDVKKTAAESAGVLVEDFGVSGIQYALVSNGKIIVSGASGVYHKADIIALDNKSMFGIGSISKMYPTTAIMLLVDQGKLDLDEPVVSYLPEFEMADDRYKEITVRMLLNHSSGIMGSSYVNSGMYDYPSTINHDNFLKGLAKQRLKGKPGEFSVYCNDGFTLAELVIEKISGMSFSEFIGKNISGPLGMSGTKTPQDDFDRNRLVRTFINGEETPIEALNAIGAGGIYSTAEDLCLLGQVYMDDSGYAPAAMLLSQDAKNKTMQKEYLRGFGPEQREGLFGYGLGWDSVDAYPYSQYNVQALIKGGDTGYYHGSLIVLPKYNMVFAALLSGGSSMYGQVMGQRVMLETLLAEKHISEIIPLKALPTPTVSQMPLELTSHTGMYANNSVVKNVNVGTNGIITVTALSNKDIPDEIYIYSSEGIFVNEDGSKTMTFVKETNEKTYIKTKGILGFPGLGKTVVTLYEYEKVEPNIIDDSAQNAWDERNATVYYIVNEISQSQVYHDPARLQYEITTNRELPGYAGEFKIVDALTALQDVQIPILSGRDLGILKVSYKDAIEYLSYAGSILISEKNIADIYAGSNALCTIREDGYARWYTVSQNDAGKTMTVNLPENASFAVYDEATCVYYSTVSGNRPVILPENGKVVFVGNSPGDRFIISIK